MKQIQLTAIDPMVFKYNLVRNPTTNAFVSRPTGVFSIRIYLFLFVYATMSPPHAALIKIFERDLFTLRSDLSVSI